ncbi:hypothetical protein V1477_013437, partial [Vespula maculifrons]
EQFTLENACYSLSRYFHDNEQSLVQRKQAAVLDNNRTVIWIIRSAIDRKWTEAFNRTRRYVSREYNSGRWKRDDTKPSDVNRRF